MTVRGLNGSRGPRPGSAAVEFAVLLPFLAFLFIIAVDFARVFYYSITLDNCALNGAIFASKVANTPGWQNNSATIDTIQKAALADAGSLSPALKSSDVTPTTGTDADGNPTVVVTVTYSFSTISNYPGLANPVTLSRTVQMRQAP
jgi:Flp pilus assembly protein TadG